VERWAPDYFEALARLFEACEATDRAGGRLGLHAAMGRAVETFRGGGKLIFIGNGASAAISSHQAVDYSKRGGVRAMAFNDGPLLTCMGNDYGYPLVFAKPIEIHADAGDVLVAISSSGGSENILNGVHAARERGCAVVTLSGMKPDNPLRGLGDLNFWVPSDGYGHVEIVHVALLHCMVDFLASR
jgi:D-sedoheptulose 7-phosphate isomerase